MNLFDRLSERLARKVARVSSRRSFLTGIGTALVGAGSVPLLPVARASASEAAPQSTGNPEDPGDPASCDYWRYCAIDGYLCACRGGSNNACPPGTEMSPITWIGTCENPADGKKYIISYNDCCGRTGCGRCYCNRNEGDKPVYRPQMSNDINWCLGTESQVYNCSTAVVLGLAIE